MYTLFTIWLTGAAIFYTFTLKEYVSKGYKDLDAIDIFLVPLFWPIVLFVGVTSDDR
jgi:hypothetical protein